MKKILQQGAEATIFLDKEENSIIKDRLPKSYRIPELDKKIRTRRTKAEAKLLNKASEIINSPKPLEMPMGRILHMEYIDGKKLSDHLENFPLKEQEKVAEEIGKSVAKLHDKNIIHGDLTTSNMIYVANSPLINQHPEIKTPTKKNLHINNDSSSLFIIDFGLGFQNGKYEDKAVDLHVLKQALEAKHFKNYEQLWKVIEKSYQTIDKTESQKVLERLKAVEKRGRYKKGS